MALTNQQLQDRIEVIENKINALQVAINNLVSRKEMKELQNVRQNEILDLQTEVNSLKAQVELLQS